MFSSVLSCLSEIFQKKFLKNKAKMGEAIPIVQEREGEITTWQLPSYLTLKFKISFKNQVNQF